MPTIDAMLGTCRAAIIDATPESQIKVALGLVLDVIQRNGRAELSPVFEQIASQIDWEARKQRTAN